MLKPQTVYYEGAFQEAVGVKQSHKDGAPHNRISVCDRHQSTECMVPRSLLSVCLSLSFFAFLPDADTVRKHLEIWRKCSPDPSQLSSLNSRRQTSAVKPLDSESLLSLLAAAFNWSWGGSCSSLQGGQVNSHHPSPGR